ncbi:MAG: hypothetical protein ACLFVQ_01800 [Chitinispirillaceae bacterium]
MEQLSENQIRKIIEDIGVMKKAVRKNRLILQQIAFTKTMQLTSVFTAFAIIGLTLIHLLLDSHYSGFSHAPLWVRILFFISVAVSFFTSSLLKTSGILKEAKNIDPAISIFKVMKEVYSHRIAHTEMAIWFLVVFLSIVSVVRGHALYIIPILSTGIGLSFLLYWVLFRVKVFLVDGYWLLLSSCTIILYPSIGAHSGLILTLGVAMVIFAVSASLATRGTVSAEELTGE